MRVEDDHAIEELFNFDASTWYRSGREANRYDAHLGATLRHCESETTYSSLLSHDLQISEGKRSNAMTPRALCRTSKAATCSTSSQIVRLRACSPHMLACLLFCRFVHRGGP